MTFTLNFQKNLSLFNLSIQETLPSHQMIAILGASGSGKTTLLHCLAGETSYEGEWHKNKRDKPSVGMVFQNYELFPHLDVRENIRYGLRWRKMSENTRKEKIELWAEELDITNLLSRTPHQLSGGEKQRVSLAQSLVLSPDVLLLDEPTSSLDTNLKYRFLENLRLLQEKWQLSIFWVTHDFQEVLSFADQVLFIDQGKVLQRGTPSELYEKPHHRKAAEFTGLINHLSQGKPNTFSLRPHHIKISLKETPVLARLVRLQNKGMHYLGEFLWEKTKIWVFLPEPILLDASYYLTWKAEDCLTFSE